MHYSRVKKETDQDNDAAEHVALLKGALATCLVQQSEMQQSIDWLTKCGVSLQQDLGKLLAQEVVDLSPDIAAAPLAPGDVTRCCCNMERLRR